MNMSSKLEYHKVEEFLNAIWEVIKSDNDKVYPNYLLYKIALKKPEKKSTFELIVIYEDQKSFLLNVNNIYYHRELKDHPIIIALTEVHQQFFSKTNFDLTNQYFSHLKEIIFINPHEEKLTIAKKIFNSDDFNLYYEKHHLEAIINNNVSPNKKLKL